MEFHVLGPVTVTDDGTPTGIGGPRQRRLLAALLIHVNRAVPTDELIEIVFEGTPPARATATIRTYVARLRKALGEISSEVRIDTVAHGYLLCLDPELIDAHRFEAEIELGRRQLGDKDAARAVATFRTALARWRGRAYGEFSSEEWVRGETARLNELRSEAHEHLADAQLACGLTDDVIAELRRQIDAEPLRERFRGQLMLALHRAGRHAEALRAFEDFRSELIELGLEPTAELVALERSVAAHDPALQLAAPAGRALRGYRLGASLGAGPHGEVFRAVQPVVGREVAIKSIRGDVADSPAFIRRFDARAQAVSKLEHAHIVPLYDFWREPNAAYVVMRLMPANLGDRLDAGPLVLDEVATMVHQIGSALHLAHREGVIHGDVQPSNIMLDADGNFYLADFRLTDVELVEAEPTGFVAPEVHGWQRPVPASDQFALAILVAYALTGTLPFGRRGVASPDDQFPSVHGHRPSIPAALDQVLWRAAAWDPDDRYDDVAAFTDDLTAALGGSFDDDRTDVASANPFRGLAPFTEADAAWFFGREAVIDDVLGRLGQDGARLVTVIGASGSGKSSVVRAGVVPRLRHGAISGSADWLITTMVPGQDPFANLNAAVRSIAAVDHDEADEERSVATVVGAAVPPHQEVLLVIDQMEELFTLTPPPVGDAFIEALTTALGADQPQLRVLATLRADFSDRPLQHSRFGRLLADGAVPLVAMSVAELDRTIREPARRSGIQIEPTLVSELIAHIADQPSALPLLQFTLTELYEHGNGGAMTLEGYRALGGVDAAVARRADEAFAGLSPAAQAQTRRLFLRLVAVDETGAATRRPATKTELAELGNGVDSLDRLLETFGSARLLSFDRDHHTREPTIEIAHESLISHWPRLDGWVLETGEGLRIRSQLTMATSRWVDGDRDDGDLYRGGRLETALSWADDHERSLTATEADYLRASTAARDAVEAARRAHLEQQERSNRRLRLLVVCVGTALVVALGAGLLAVRQWNRADRHATRAETRELVAASGSNLGADPDLTVLLALEALRSSDGKTRPEAVQALHLAVLDHRLIGSVPIGTDQSGEAAFAPDGTFFAAIGEDPLTIDVWSTESLQRRLTLTGHTEPVRSVTYSPDGEAIATTGEDGTVRLWDANTGDSIAVQSPPPLGAYGRPSFGKVVISPDGSSVATRFAERTFIWDIDSGEEIIRLRASDAPPGLDPRTTDGLAFHPGGGLLATTQNTSSRNPPGALVWDLTSYQPIDQFSAHTAIVTDVDFSPDGSLLYSASHDGTIRIWDIEQQVLVDTFTGHDSEVLSIDVAQDGTSVASVGASGALVWDAETFKVIARLSGHVGPIDSVELSPDGLFAVTASRADGTAKLWTLAAPTEMMSAFVPADAGDASPGGALVFDATGATMTVAQGAQLISWSFPDGERIAAFPAPGDQVSELVIDHSGTRLAAAGDLGTAVLAVDGGDVIVEPFIGMPTASVAFAPGGPQLISTGPGAKLNDLDTGKQRSVLSAWLWTYDAAYRPDGRQLALAHTEHATYGPAAATNEGVVDVIDTETLSVTATIPVGPSRAGHTDQVVDLEFSPDGSLLATASKDASAILWSVDGYEEALRLVGHTNELTVAAFDLEGTTLATASLDATIKIWEIGSGRNLLTLPGRRPITDIVYTPDGRYLAATDATGQVAVYMLDTDELVAEAHRRLTRELTDAECVQYLHTETCPTQ